jgi:hypothetical protein
VAVLDDLVASNESFAAGFDRGLLEMPPRVRWPS